MPTAEGTGVAVFNGIYTCAKPLNAEGGIEVIAIAATNEVEFGVGVRGDVVLKPLIKLLPIGENAAVGRMSACDVDMNAIMA